MEKIAFIIGETFLYWNSIILMLAVAAAVCLFLAFCLRRPGNGAGAAVLVSAALALSVVLSRLIHWYCRSDAYESLESALTNYAGGGYALTGVFAGCVIAAVLLRLLRIVKNLPHIFDCMALGGGAGIAVGRLACLYSAADRGMLVEASWGFPLMYPVPNAVTGITEYRLATFLLQAIATGVIFLVLTVFYLRGTRRGRLKDGDTACLFLSAYCASQVVLDSTRYDSLFLRSNGFVSVVQILCAICLVGMVVYFSVRMVRSGGFRKRYLLLWLAAAVLTGGAGFMEYWVQRHGDQALFCYSVMSVCLAGLVVLICRIRFRAVFWERKPAVVENANI